MSVEKILLVLGGEPPDEDLLHWRFEDCDLTVAVDSGWLACRSAGLLPDILIGDMDSCGETDLQNGIPTSVRVIIDSDQNITDFQKALNLINSDYSPLEIVILGGFGKRTDHLLNNLSIVSGIQDDIIVVLDSGDEWIRRVTPSTSAEVRGMEGATISLIPQRINTVVHSSGLKWELENEVLSWSYQFSQSNEFVSDFSKISVLSGALLIILQK
ncbi:MAG: thiamine diphosphokinase [Opitutae bacterium]|nr:thiamine diphosphokinase [Opitutae bacterium]